MHERLNEVFVVAMLGLRGDTVYVRLVPSSKYVLSQAMIYSIAKLSMTNKAIGKFCFKALFQKLCGNLYQIVFMLLIARRM